MLELQIISSIHFYRVIENILFILICCWSPNCSSDKTFAEKYEVKHIFYSLEVTKNSAKNIFRHSTKRLQSKESIIGHTINNYTGHTVNDYIDHTVNNYRSFFFFLSAINKFSFILVFEIEMRRFRENFN